MFAMLAFEIRPGPAEPGEVELTALTCLADVAPLEVLGSAVVFRLADRIQLVEIDACLAAVGERFPGQFFYLLLGAFGESALRGRFPPHVALAPLRAIVGDVG